jgi:PAS domain S-box-containing protein
MADPADPIHVLHVDDDARFSALVSDFLERENEQLIVHTATDPSDGREIVDESDVACIVSGYDLSRTNGVEFLETVREDDPDLPFILYTGKGSEEVAADAISAGVTDYLQKESGTDQYTILANRIVNAVDRYRIEHEAQKTRTQLQAISENSADAIMVIDADSRIMFANPAVEEYFGYTASELEGDRLTRIMPERYREDHRASMERYLETGERSVNWNNMEFPGLHRDGHEIPLSVSYAEFQQDGEQRFIGIMRDISERTRLEDELREREQRFRQLAENIQEVVWMSDPEKEEMIYANPAYEEIWGRSVESLYEEPTTFLDAVHPEDRDRVEAAVDSQRTGDYDEEYRIVRPDGDLRWIRDRAIPVKNDAGEVYRIVGVASDITERREQERKRERVIQRVTDAIVEVDSEWRFTLVNDQAEELYDMDEESLLGRDFWDVFAEARGTRFEDEYRQVMETREPTSLVEYFPQLDGWFDIEAYPTANGGVAFYFLEVTEERERRRELQEVNERLDLALHGTDTGVWEWNLETDEVAWDETAERIVGLDPGTFEGTLEAFKQRVHPDDLSAARDAITHAIEHDELYDTEFRMFHESGDVIWVSARGRRVDGEEEPGKVIGIFQDITERKQFERTLQEERQRFEQVLETSPVGIVILDSDGRIARSNVRAEEILGRTDSEITGRTYDDQEWEIVGEDGDPIPADDLPFARVLASGEAVYNYEHGIRWPDGTERWLSIHAAPITTDGGDVEQVVSVISDITAGRAHERAIEAQNERLEEFADVLSHELRNPLNIAQESLELAQTECDSEHLETIGRAHDRMEALITDLPALARDGEVVTELSVVDLADLAESCWETVDTGTATLVTDVERRIRADESRLRQLFENLIRSGVEHGGSGVTVTVGELDDGFYIEDDGTGFPADDHDAAFAAGCATSASGTGFGLNTVTQVVKVHDWEISVTDGSGGGSRFEITGVEYATG